MKIKHAGLAVGILQLALVLTVVGCNKGGDTTSGAGPGTSGPSRSSGGPGAGGSGDGAALLASSKCERCHGAGGAGKGNAPPINHEGSIAEHTADWLAAFIADPGSKVAGSKMPPQKGNVSEENIQTIATYLASQK